MDTVIFFLLFLAFSGLEGSTGEKNQCGQTFDIGFLLDSSNSIRDDYQLEKRFIEKLAMRFGISKEGSHAGVIVFSAASQVKTMIRLNQYYNIEEFREAVANLPFFGFVTRIDLALKEANDHLFTVEAGARPGVKKLLFLITDGRQNPPRRNGKILSPVLDARPLHEKKIKIYAIGIGDRVKLSELFSITRSKKKVYTVDNFEQLLDENFIEQVSNQSCNHLAEESSVNEENAHANTSRKNETNKSFLTDREPADEIGLKKNKTNDGDLPDNQTVRKFKKCKKDGGDIKCENDGGRLPDDETTRRFERTPDREEKKGKKCDQCDCCCQKAPIYVNIYNGGNNFIIQDKTIKPVKAPSNDWLTKEQPENESTPDQIKDILKLIPSSAKWGDEMKSALISIASSCKNTKDNEKD